MLSKEQIDRIIDLHFSNPSFSVASLAEMLGISGSYLRDEVHRLYHLSPFTIIENYRLEKATQMLLSDLDLYTICHASGYAHVRTFRDAVRKRLGKPPSELRGRNDSESIQNLHHPRDNVVITSTGKSPVSGPDIP